MSRHLSPARDEGYGLVVETGDDVSSIVLERMRHSEHVIFSLVDALMHFKSMYR